MIENKPTKTEINFRIDIYKFHFLIVEDVFHIFTERFEG